MIREKSCFYRGKGCLFSTASCEQSVAASCGEAKRRNELAKIICPLMKGCKNEKNRGCDQVDLLALVPGGCFVNGNCIFRSIKEAIAVIHGDTSIEEEKLKLHSLFAKYVKLHS